jgi:hypothetical protein
LLAEETTPVLRYAKKNCQKPASSISSCMMSLWFLSCSLDTRQAVGADVKFILFKRMLGKIDRDRDRAARNGWDSNRLLFQHSSHSSVTFFTSPDRR